MPSYLRGVEGGEWWPGTPKTPSPSATDAEVLYGHPAVNYARHIGRMHALPASTCAGGCNNALN